MVSQSQSFDNSMQTHKKNKQLQQQSHHEHQNSLNLALTGLDGDEIICVEQQRLVTSCHNMASTQSRQTT